MRRTYVGIGIVLGLLAGVPAEAAPPKPKANPAQNQPPVDADKLPAGQFSGTLVSLPNSDRMFTLKITYPELRLKPGAKMPRTGNVRMPHVQNMNRQFQQLQRMQSQMNRGMSHHHAIHNMMQMQQMFMQMQMNQQRMAMAEARMAARMQQQMVKAEQQLVQQELKLLRQQIQAIRNMYQVVQVSRNFDFQADENIKVRLKDLPEQFDDKGNIKKYTAQEKAELKGKDKNLPGYESSPDALQAGQVVLVALRAYKKPKPASKLNASVANAKDAAKDKDADKDADKDKDKDAAKDKDKDKDADASLQHKMQVKMIVILQESSAGNSTTPTKKK